MSILLGVRVEQEVVEAGLGDHESVSPGLAQRLNPGVLDTYQPLSGRLHSERRRQ